MKKSKNSPYPLVANRYNLDRYTFGWERPQRERIKLSRKEKEILAGVSDFGFYLTCFEKLFLDGVREYHEKNRYITPKQHEKLRKIIELPNRKEDAEQWFEILRNNPKMVSEYIACLKQLNLFKRNLCFIGFRRKEQPITERKRIDISSERFYDAMSILTFQRSPNILTLNATHSFFPLKKEYEWVVNNHYGIKSWKEELQRLPVFKEGQLVTLRRGFFTHGEGRIRKSSNNTLWTNRSSQGDYKNLVVYCWHTEHKNFYNLKLSQNTKQGIAEANSIYKAYKRRLKEIEEKMVFRIVKPYDDSIRLQYYAKGAKMVQMIPLCRNALCDEIKLVNVEERYLKPWKRGKIAR